MRSTQLQNAPARENSTGKAANAVPRWRVGLVCLYFNGTFFSERALNAALASGKIDDKHLCEEKVQSKPHDERDAPQRQQVSSVPASQSQSNRQHKRDRRRTEVDPARSQRQNVCRSQNDAAGCQSRSQRVCRELCWGGTCWLGCLIVRRVSLRLPTCTVRVEHCHICAHT